MRSRKSDRDCGSTTSWTVLVPCRGTCAVGAGMLILKVVLCIEVCDWHAVELFL
jgi:hypothetical protein